MATRNVTEMVFWLLFADSLALLWAARLYLALSRRAEELYAT